MKILFTVFLICFFGISAHSQKRADTTPVKILPLGNSITNGTDTFNSYRRDLWKMLIKAGYNVDFIGSWNKHHNGGKVPDPDFDMDHEGHSGWTAADMFHPPAWDSSRGNISQWLKVYSPDIVLLELGTNDVFQCRKAGDVLKDLAALVDLLRNKNPAVKIFIAQIPPLGAKWKDQKLCSGAMTYDQSIQELNGMISRLCKTITTKRSLVCPVDQYTGIDPSINMYDDIHPNDSGEAIMAGRWFDAIRKYLPKL